MAIGDKKPVLMESDINAAGGVAPAGAYSLTNEEFLPENADLNNYITPGENYRCTTQAIAKTILNTPFGEEATAGFSLHVERTSGVTGLYLHQILRYNNTNATTYKRAYNGNWGEWAKDYSSNDKPTLAEIGAAPTGYGLGTAAEYLAGVDLNTVTKNGWYRLATTCPGYPTEADGIGVGGGTLMEVVSANTSSFTTIQTIHLGTADQQGLSLRRYYHQSNKLWSAWEWINPPMTVGVEYRTIERYKNKPVFVKALLPKSIPATGTTKFPHQAENLTYVIEVYGNAGVSPLLNSPGVTDVSADATDLIITTSGATAVSVTPVIKYVKSS